MNQIVILNSFQHLPWRNEILKRVQDDKVKDMEYQNKSVSSNKIGQYKALILDVDGTLIPKEKDGRPSQNVIDAIAQVKDRIHVGIATSRPISVLGNIVDNIKFSGPSIINGGSEIIDFPSKKILWEKEIEREDAKKICRELQKFTDHVIYLNSGGPDIAYDPKKIPEKLLQIYVAGFTLDEAEELVKKFSSLSSYAGIYKVPSFQKGKIDIIMTHASATKQHGIAKIAELLGISTHEIIGVGDGYNDFPLLMACGLKVAMGNAVDDLKAIADYVAPSVEDDGVADIINRFVLN